MRDTLQVNDTMRFSNDTRIWFASSMHNKHQLWTLVCVIARNRVNKRFRL